MSFRFAIIGAGLTGTSMLCQFIRRLRRKTRSGSIDPRRVHILVFDRQPVAGPGFPHNARFVQPYHITNMCADEMSAIYARPRDFSDWIERRRIDLSESLPAYRAILGDPDYRQPDCSHYPRALMGEYLKERFQEALQIAAGLGVKVDVHLDCEVTNIIDERKGVRIQVRDCRSGSDRRFFANQALLATGHWQRDDSAPGYFPTPWPAQRLLEQIPQGAAVAVIGSSLSAIETVLTLTSDGDFTSSASGALHYRSGPNPRRITLLSRHGLLPRVRARKMQFQPRYFTQENLRCLLKRRSGNLSLETIFALFDRELAAAMGKPFDWRTVTSPGGSPESRLEQDLRQACSGNSSSSSALWQSILRQCFPLVRELYLALSVADRERFERDFATLFFMHAATQPPVNAHKILALMRAGVVDIVKLGKDYRLIENAFEPVYDFCFGEGNANRLSFRYVVDARGQQRSVSDDPSPLTRNLIQNGNILLDECARGEPTTTKNKTPSPTQSLQYPGKTLCIDTDTHQVLQIDRNGGIMRSKSLYAVGSMTRGQIIDVSMAKGLTRSTDCIARQLVDRLHGKRHNHH